jgi:hypothetical protein
LAGFAVYDFLKVRVKLSLLVIKMADELFKAVLVVFGNKAEKQFGDLGDLIAP